jgi:MFS family permease
MRSRSSARRSGSASPEVGEHLRRRNFWLLWSGLTVSRLGDGLFAAVVAWTAWDLGRSPWSVGLAELAAWSPRVAFSFVGGVFADGHDRRRMMIISDVIRAGLVVELAVLLMTHSLGMGTLLACSAGVGLVSVPFEVARFAIVPQLVNRERLVGANALLQLGYRCAFAVGPLLLAAAGRGLSLSSILMADALSFLFSAATIRAALLPAPTGSPDVGTEPSRSLVSRAAGADQLRRELADGVRVVRQLPDVALAIATFAVSLLLVSGFRTVGLTALVGTRFGNDPATYGFLNAVLGVAEVVGALALSRIRMMDLAAWAMLSWAALGLFRAPLGFSPHVPAAAALLGLTGLASAAADVSIVTLIHTRVDGRWLGRTFGLWQTATAAAAALSPLLAAFVFSRTGIAAGFAVSGIMVATLGLSAWPWTSRSANRRRALPLSTRGGYGG